MKPMLIAEIGSSKGEWVYSHSGVEKKLITKGFNPIDLKAEPILEVLNQVKSQFTLASNIQLYLYSAGLDEEKSIEFLHQLCSQVFGCEIAIELNSDILAAARACYSDYESGLIAILGTGSNLRSIEKGKLIGESKALGYVLGDDGAGVGLGKRIVNKFIHNQLPDVFEVYLKQKGFNRTSILQAVYQQPYPQKYIAQFAQLAFDFRHLEVIQAEIRANFRLFFEQQLCEIPNIETKTLKCVGSVAFYFKEDLEAVAHEFGLKIHQIIQKPMAQLCAYHQKKYEI